MKEMCIILGNFNWLIFGVHIYLSNMNLLQGNESWHPFWINCLDTIKLITFGLWLFTFVVELFVSYRIYKEKKRV